MTRIPQRAFAGGIVSPGFYPRTDIPKRNQALKDAANVTLRAEGGAVSRPGTEAVTGWDVSTEDGYPWLIPFEASDEDTYILEFGEQVMRVIKAGAYVLDSTIGGQSVTAIAEGVTPTTQFTMSSGAAAAEFTVGRLVYFDDPNGSSVFGGQVFKVSAISGDKVSFRVFGDANITGTGLGAVGAGATLHEVYQIATPYAIEDMPRVQHGQDVDTMFLAHDGYDFRQLQRIADDDWTLTVPSVAPAIAPPAGVSVEAEPSSGGSYTYVVTAYIEGGSPSESAPTNEVTVENVIPQGQNKNTLSWDAFTGSYIGYRVYRKEGDGAYERLAEYAGASTTYVDDGTASPAASGPPSPGAAGGPSDLTIDVSISSQESYAYKVSAVAGGTGEESLPSSSVSVVNDLTVEGNTNTVAWSAVPGASLYRVYKDFNGIFGFIGVTEALSFEDRNITPDTADNPQTARDPFSGAGNKPAAVAFVSQRLALAATENNRQAVEMSSSVAPLNFNRAITPGASDAVSFRMRAQKLNRVFHIVEAEKPLILTAGAEWYIDTRDDEAIAPGNFSLRVRSYRGSARTPRPIIVGENLLHVTRDGNTLREFSLSGERATASADLTLLARHLFRGKTITSLAYAQAPDSVIWVTLETGELYTLTYLVEHEVWGWTRQEIGGEDVFVRQVATVTEGSYDTPYIVVTRTLQGEARTVVERVTSREYDGPEDCYFVDGGLKVVSATASTTLRGLLHLRGETVSVLYDGNVLGGRVVSELGTVVLPVAASKVSVGLGYDAYLVLLDSDLGDQIGELGASLGRFLTVDEVALKVVDTRGVAVGREGGQLNEIKQVTGATPTPLYTGTLVAVIDGDWERDQAIEVRQVYPLPMTITAVAPSLTLGE